MQLTLDMPELERRSRPVLNLLAYNLIVICSSAGKGSMALLAYVAELVGEQSYRERVVVLHNDLGVTRSGEPVEWWGVEAAAREHAERYGFECVVRRRPSGGLWISCSGSGASGWRTMRAGAPPTRRKARAAGRPPSCRPRRRTPWHMTYPTTSGPPRRTGNVTKRYEIGPSTAVRLPIEVPPRSSLAESRVALAREGTPSRQIHRFRSCLTN